MELRLEQVMAAACVEWHAGHLRKYTNEPYEIHLAQVAGLVSMISVPEDVELEVVRAVLWGHDCVEDVGVTLKMIRDKLRNFPADKVDQVIEGIDGLTDREKGNRYQRLAKKTVRLSNQPAWIQTAKNLDIYSNAISIAVHDPQFAKILAWELELITESMTKADKIARGLARYGVKILREAAKEHSAQKGTPT